jgi:hypothetical protein
MQAKHTVAPAAGDQQMNSRCAPKTTRASAGTLAHVCVLDLWNQDSSPHTAI